jgi:quinol monooxygenase YgiN
MRLARLLALALFAAMTSTATTAGAEEAGDGAVYTVTYIDAAPATRAANVRLLRQLTAASRQQPGVVRYEAFQRDAPSNQFAIIEIWKDQQAYDAHAASAPVKTFREQIEPNLIAPIDERPYVGLAVGPKDGAAIPSGGAVAISHVDVIPPKKDDGIAALKTLAGPTRADQGNLRFDAYQQKARPNHFTVIEVWRNQRTADAHEVAAHTKQFRQVLSGATGALYDQRWYKAL